MKNELNWSIALDKHYNTIPISPFLNYITSIHQLDENFQEKQAEKPVCLIYEMYMMLISYLNINVTVENLVNNRSFSIHEHY
jgi:hypothetical protein